MPGKDKCVTAFRRSELKNATQVWKALKKLLHPLIIRLVVAAASHPIDYKLRDPWTTLSEFSNQVHDKIANVFGSCGNNFWPKLILKFQCTSIVNWH